MGDEREADARYWAFISYSHEDRRWARWLHRRLERYRVPRRLVGRRHWSGATPRQLSPIFRDRDELPSSADLGGVIGEALRESRYLIVICSPRAARSRWVNEEVETFKRLGREDRVLCLKIGRNAGAAEGFVPALRTRYDASGAPTGERAEPLAADTDARADGRDGAVLKLIAGMLGVGYDELRQRERRRRWRNRLLVGATAFMLAGLIVSGWRWQQAERQQALAAQALQARIAQLYEAGRREVLAHNETRAAVLLAQARQLGLRHKAVDYLLGRAMRAVDAQQLRIDTGVPIRFVSLDAQNRQLLSYSEDQNLRVFDAQRGTVLHILPLGVSQTIYADFSPRGGLIWVDSDHVAAPRRRLRLIEAGSGQLLREVALAPSPAEVAQPPLDHRDRQFVYVDPGATLVVETLGGAVRRLAGDYVAARFCGDDDSVIAARSDGVIEWRDAATLQLRRQFDGLQSTPTMLDATSACTLIVAGASDGAVRVWRTRDGAIRMSGGHRNTIIDLRMSADGERLLAASRGDVGVWNPQTGTLLYALRQRDPSVNLVLMSADARTLLRLSEGRLAALDPETGRERLTLDGHRGGPVSFGLGGDGSQVVSGGADGGIIVWQVPADLVIDLHGLTPAAAQTDGIPVAVAADGRHFATIGRSHRGELWQFDPLQTLRVLDGAPPRALGFSADAQRLATASADGLIRVVDVGSGTTLWQHAATTEPALYVELDHRGQRLAAALSGHIAQVWAVHDGKSLLRVPRDEARAQALSPRDGGFAVGKAGVVQLWDLDRGTLRWASALPLADGVPARISVLVFSADGQRLLAAAQQREAFVLDAADGRVLHRLDEPASIQFSVGSFSPDGRQIALGDAAKSSLLWRPQDARVLQLGGHTAALRAVSFSADSALLASSGFDGEIRIWDTQAGVLLDSFSAHEGGVLRGNARFSVDGRYLLSGGSDGAARLWALAAEARTDELLAHLLRCRAPWTPKGVTLQPDTPRCAADAAPVPADP